MTDLDATSAGTRTCPNCGAQNDAAALRCDHCGGDLSATGAPDTERGDLEVEEAWRAAAAEGFDTDFESTDDGVVCAICGSVLLVADATERRWAARDTPSGRDDLAVAAMRCPTCGTTGRVVVDLAAFDRPEAAGPDVDPSEVEWQHDPPPGSTPDHPLGADRHHLEPAGPGTLAEREPLLDDEGEDIRQYTGEPVETEEGWVVPRQQNVGPGNEAGSGEWPDPDTPSVMAKGDEPDR